MNRNSLLAIVSVCITLNMLAGAYVYVNYRNAALPESLPKTTEATGVDDRVTGEGAAVISDGSEALPASIAAEGSVQSKRKSPASAKKEYVIRNLDKYLNFVPSSNAVTPDGFNKIYFSIINSSDYSFDRVSVNFRCFLKDGSLWNEKTYTVGPIAPHSKLDQLIPDQYRGHSIKWQTLAIESAELGYSWPK